ncbi:BC_2427 family protein [Oceanobacillus sp. CF4.6]|uniref:BC_2427 family protein n=1 Tax=Oceanobacillus sp. CF4.6 TaxID=3373080 RepID=UPI003EE48F48
MKFNNNKIRSLSAPKNTKAVELSNHKNANKHTIVTGYNTSIRNQVKHIKVPFSTYIKIDNFLQQPIFVHTVERSLNFKDQTGMSPDFETSQLNTSTYYHEQPYGRLVFSNVHSMMNLNKESSKVSKKNNNFQQEITKPFKQNSNSLKGPDIFSNTFPFAKFLIPVVLGEYDIEIVLEENTPMDKGIIRILDVSTEVVLTNCKFLPSNFKHSSDQEKRIASNGILFVEGYIQESMEYLPAINWEKISPREWLKKVYYRVDQKIMAHLKIQLLQLVQIENSRRI